MVDVRHDRLEGDGGDLGSAHLVGRPSNLFGLGPRLRRCRVRPARGGLDHLDVQIEPGQGGNVKSPHRCIPRTGRDECLTGGAYLCLGSGQRIGHQGRRADPQCHAIPPTARPRSRAPRVELPRTMPPRSSLAGAALRPHPGRRTFSTRPGRCRPGQRHSRHRLTSIAHSNGQGARVALYPSISNGSVMFSSLRYPHAPVRCGTDSAMPSPTKAGYPISQRRRTPMSAPHSPDHDQDPNRRPR